MMDQVKVFNCFMVTFTLTSALHSLIPFNISIALSEHERFYLDFRFDLEL